VTHVGRSALTIPNLVTACRLLLAPVVIFALIEGRPRLALALFAIAALTDGVDGYLARRFNWISDTGIWLDPVADKLLLSGVFLALAWIGQVPWWFVALVFGRDLFILAGAGAVLLVTGPRKLPPSRWGKLSTFLQVLAAVSFLARGAAPDGVFQALPAALVWPTAAATLWSGLHYGWRGLRLLRDH